MVGKLINNERVDTIIQTKLEFWCMSLGFPTSRPFEDNGGEFSNVKLDELTSKPGITVKFGLPHLPWSNGIDEKNHALADLTIKKLMGEKITALTDSLMEAAA